MKTNQLMKRDFQGQEVTQRTDNSYLSATDLLSCYNENSETKKRLFDFMNNQGTKEFAEALCLQLNLNDENSRYLESSLLISTRGKSGATFMHPYLFIKFAMWLSPDFEVKVIGWVFDNLIKIRNQAGDHYLQMCQVIHDVYTEAMGRKPDPLVFIKEANFLKSLAFGSREKERNEATEQELKLLTALQKANAVYIKAKVPKKIRMEKLRDFAIVYS